MRFLVRLAIVVAVIWCTWWALASWGAHRGLSDLIAARQADGWQAQISQSGFPLRIRSDLRNVVLRDPQSDLALRTESLGLSVPTYWPGYLILDLPQTPIFLDTGVAELEIIAEEAEAELRLHPGTTLELEGIHLRSQAWRVSAGGAELATSAAFSFALLQDPDQLSRYALTLDAAELSPGSDLRADLKLDTGWPLTFNAFDARAILEFDKPLDRHATEGDPPRLRSLVLKKVDFTWGEISLTAEGALDVDAEGLPDGEMRLSFQNWRVALDLAEYAGAISSEMRGQASIFLAALANQAGSPESIDLALTFEAGRLSSNGVLLGTDVRF